MRNRIHGRSLIQRLSLIVAGATLILVTGASPSQAVAPAPASAVSTAATSASPSPSPSPTGNATVTNPGPLPPGSPHPGVKPKTGPSRLGRALLAAGTLAPSSSLPAGPCTLSGTIRFCDLYATTGTLTLPTQPQSGVPVPAPLLLPVWGFSTIPGPGTAVVPGPVLIANAGETIQINVHNQLPLSPDGLNPLSIEVAASGSMPDIQGIAPGTQRTYTFGSLKPGTYLYEAGPTPFAARQVRMGLAGILIVRPAAFATCNCAYGNVPDQFVDEATLQLNEFDPGFNADPFGFDPIDFTPTEFTINGLAYDPANPTAGKINVAAGDVLLIHYADLGDHERGITIANERQTILASDSYQLTNPSNVATEWLNPGQVADSFVTVDPSFPLNSHIPVYDSGFHFSNGANLGLGGAFTYLDVVQAIAGNPTGPVSTVVVNPPTNSGTEDMTVTGTITASGGATLTDAEWFLDDPGPAGLAQQCPTGGLSLITGGSGYKAPVVTFTGGGGTGATATATGSMDAVTVTAGGAGYTTPSVTIAGGSATASGSVNAVNVTTPGAHYTLPTAGVSGGGGSGAVVTTTGPVDSLSLGTNGAGYTSPSVAFSGGAGTGASATVSGSVDSAKLTTPGAGYTAPVVTLSGGGAGTGASVTISGGVDSLTVTAPGAGYTAPVVSITGGGGTGATATAQFDSTTGAITGLTITNAGTGYTSAPAVAINDTAPSTGAGATATSTINLNAIAVGAAGSGYSSAPLIGITDSSGTGAAATLTISVTVITLGSGGSGYSSAPGVAINDTGTPVTVATAASTIGVTGAVLMSGGAGYTSAPAVAITDTGTGSGAIAAATLTITTVTINSGGAGTGYNPAPTVLITDLSATGGGATAFATLTVTGLTLTNAGTGYTTAPTVNINDSTGGTGTGATAVALQPATPCLYQHFAVSGSSSNYSFSIASADLNNLLLSSLNRDGDHIIWVQGQDSTGTWGVVAGDVFTYNATGPVVGALSVHASPTNGNRPTDVANGGGPNDPITGVAGNAPSTDLVILGMAAASLSNFSVTAAEYCIDTHPCPPVPNTSNPNGPTAIVLTPSGSDGNQQIDAYGNPLTTPVACTPLASPPGVAAPGLPGAPGGGSIVSFCGTVPTATLQSLSEGAHTLYIHACEQLSSSTGGCATQPKTRWAAFSADASIGFVIDRTGPTASRLSLNPNPNNGHQNSSGNLNFLDSIQFTATLTDAPVAGTTVGSNIAYAEVFVTCSPNTQPSTCHSTSGPIDPVTGAAPPNGTGAEMIPSGSAWDTPTKLAFGYIPLAELTAYPEGFVRFWVHAQDQAGNFGPWAYTELTYDKTSPVFDTPVLPVPPAAPTTIACRTGCTINFTAHDPVSGGVNSNIIEGEWFVDQGAHLICEINVPGCVPEVAGPGDPGYGSGTPIPITTAPSTALAGHIVLGPQARGTQIVFRVRDAAGNWSLGNLVVTR
jgi:hypothetical protein